MKRPYLNPHLILNQGPANGPANRSHPFVRDMLARCWTEPTPGNLARADRSQQHEQGVRFSIADAVIQ